MIKNQYKTLRRTNKRMLKASNNFNKKIFSHMRAENLQFVGL